MNLVFFKRPHPPPRCFSARPSFLPWATSDSHGSPPLMMTRLEPSETETHWVLCPYLWPTRHLVIFSRLRDFLQGERDALLGRWTEEKPMSVSDGTLTQRHRCPLLQIYQDVNTEAGDGREERKKLKKSITISKPWFGE